MWQKASTAGQICMQCAMATRGGRAKELVIPSHAQTVAPLYSSCIWQQQQTAVCFDGELLAAEADYNMMLPCFDLLAPTMPGCVTACW